MDKGIIFNGINLYYNGKKQIDNITILISNETVLLNIDNINICSFYPENMEKSLLANCVADELQVHNIEQANLKAEAIADYINAMYNEE